MSSNARSCLTPQELERLLGLDAGASQEDERLDHVRSCGTCAHRLSELRSQSDLFEEIRLSMIDDPDLAAGDHAPAFNGIGISANPWQDIQPPGYEILHELRRGGQGVVYKAVQLATRRIVALKVLLARASDERRQWRFEREIELVASLRHPNLVTVFDSGISGGCAYYSMEFVDGLPLNKYLAQSQWPLTKKLMLFLSICRAVHFAHQRGVLHRDLKPDNILIDADGSPHVLDFGLAKAIDDSAEAAFPVTITGEFMGTLAYVSPEQAGAGGGPVDVRTDVYSLGVILYEAATGKLPYEASPSLPEAIRNIIEANPPRPSSHNRLIDSDLETILLTSLAKDRERRYASVDALAADLENHLAGRPIEARRDSTWYVLRKTISRHRWAAGLTCVIILALAALSVVMSVLLHQTRQEAERARSVQTYLQKMLASAGSTELGPDVRFVDVLQTAERFIEAELVHQPQIEASLRLTLGRTYSSLWKWVDARRNLLTAQRLLETSPEASPIDLIECRLLLGSAMAELNGRRSLPVLRQALNDARTLEGGQSHLRSACLVETAHALTRVGSPADLPEAQRLLAEARSGYQEAGQKISRGMARCLSRLALLNEKLNRLEDAEANYQQSLKIYERLTLQEDSQAIQTALDYAAFLRARERLADAEAVVREVLASYPATLSRDQKPFILWQLAQLRASRGDYVDAERCFRESLAISCNKMAEKYPQAWEALNRCAIDLWSMPSDKGDVLAYTNAFDLLLTLEGVPQPALAQGMFDLAQARLEQGDSSGAAALASRCMQLRSRLLPSGHAGIAAAASLLARIQAGSESLQPMPGGEPSNAEVRP